MMPIPQMRRVAEEHLRARGLSRPGQDGSTLFMYRELEVNRFHFRFTLRDVGPGQRLVSFGCAFVSNAIGEAVNHIDGERHVVFPAFPTQPNAREVADLPVDDDTIIPLCDEHLTASESFAASTSFAARQEQILATLDVPGSHQLWHLAALAATGEVDRLNELRAALGTEGRGGLYPYVTDDMVRRAVEVAERVG